MYVDIREEDDILLLETFVKGLDDHFQSTKPRVKTLQVRLMKNSDQCLYWTTKAKCWAELKQIEFESKTCTDSDLSDFLPPLDELQFLIESWEWISALKSEWPQTEKGVKYPAGQNVFLI